MNLKKPLTVETICLDLKGATKEAILAEMVDLLVASGHIRDRDAVLKAVLEREKRMSTGMQNGIAIPHGKTDSVDCLVAALGIKRAGVDFGALDVQLADLELDHAPDGLRPRPPRDDEPPPAP